MTEEEFERFEQAVSIKNEIKENQEVLKYITSENANVTNIALQGSTWNFNIIAISDSLKSDIMRCLKNYYIGKIAKLDKKFREI